MPLVTLTFNSPINTSAQVGDMVYYIPTLPAGTFNRNDLSQGKELGELISFQNKEGLLSIPIQIEVNCINGVDASLITNDFIMFSKNKSVNTSGLVGYYAKVKLTNNSKESVEIFSLGSDITINSQ